MNISADIVVYIYLISCVTLMAYNLSYILQGKRRNRKSSRRQEMWRNEVLGQLERLSAGQDIEPRHAKKLSRKLINTDVLISYSRALDAIKLERPELLADYVNANYVPFQELAHKYRRRQSMERAFYADFISRFPPYASGEHRLIIDSITSYMTRSTVYCRENVMRAVFALGNVQAVENALQMLNDSGLFHHQKLISDGLAASACDKEELASVLWSKYKKWNSQIMLAVVQFITTCSPNFKEVFLPVLQDSSADIEIRLAIMRYYRRYPYEPARRLLKDFLTNAGEGNESFAIVAASVLSQYPGSDTVSVLKKALSSRNWYVRHNAAATLAAIVDDKIELQDVLKGNDKYARDIMAYMLRDDSLQHTSDHAVRVFGQELSVSPKAVRKKEMYGRRVFGQWAH